MLQYTSGVGKTWPFTRADHPCSEAPGKRGGLRPTREVGSDMPRSPVANPKAKRRGWEAEFGWEKFGDAWKVEGLFRVRRLIVVMKEVFPFQGGDEAGRGLDWEG
jgi:hypothetical protein